jgi:hypothetical protein
VVASAYREHAQTFAHPGWVEHDAFEIRDIPLEKELHDLTDCLGDDHDFAELRSYWEAWRSCLEE